MKQPLNRQVLEPRLRELQRKANDALQIITLSAEAHRFVELNDAQTWRDFHQKTMQDIQKAAELLGESLQHLNQMLEP